MAARCLMVVPDIIKSKEVLTVAQRMQCSEYEAVGHLIEFCDWFFSVAPSGSSPGLKGPELYTICRFKRELVQALFEVGWLRRENDSLILSTTKIRPLPVTQNGVRRRHGTRRCIRD